MTTRKSVTGILGLLVTFLFITSCGGASSPTDPPDPPLPLPDLTVIFSDAQVSGATITMVGGDSLGCVIGLSPPSENVVVGVEYDGGVAICSSVYGPIGVPPKLMYFASKSIIVPVTGVHSLEFQRYARGGAKLGDPVAYTLMVLPREESPAAGQQIAFAR